MAAAMAAAIHAAGDRAPGFGHPLHRPVDPRAERILELADERGAAGPHVAMARHFGKAVPDAWGRPLTMNVSMPIAAVMLDLGFPASSVKAVPLLARTAGLLAHLAEEREQPIGFLMAGKAEEAIAYRPAGGAVTLLDPEVEARPWDQQLALDDIAYRAQLAYLLRAFALLPREAGGGRGHRGRAGGRPGRHLAAAADREAGAAGERHRGQPDRRAPLRRPGADRAHLLHQRNHRHSQLHPADRFRS